MERLLTVEEVSGILKVSKSTIYRWVCLNYIPYVKLGGSVRFDGKAIVRWLKDRERVGRNELSVDVFLE
jgi:excisionase family DNA binding protein